MLPHVTANDLGPYRECFLAGFLSMLAVAMQLSNREPDPIGRMMVFRDYFREHTAMMAEGKTP